MVVTVRTKLRLFLRKVARGFRTSAQKFKALIKRTGYRIHSSMKAHPKAWVVSAISAVIVTGGVIYGIARARRQVKGQANSPDDYTVDDIDDFSFTEGEEDVSTLCRLADQCLKLIPRFSSDDSDSLLSDDDLADDVSNRFAFLVGKIMHSMAINTNSVTVSSLHDSFVRGLSNEICDIDGFTNNTDVYHDSAVANGAACAIINAGL